MTTLDNLFQDLDWKEFQVWPEAELMACLRYGRGMKGLCIPNAWKGVDDLFRCHL